MINRKMLLFSFILIVVIIAVIVVGCTKNGQNEDNKKPNIVIIIADDVGWNDISLHGSNQIPTPNIDALGYNGVILNRFYAQQTCTPSRAALLTGNYPIRSGMQGEPISVGEDRSIPANMPVMPEYFKKLGYKTHLVGKWHLGAAHERDTPTSKGFDTHFGYWYGYVGYFTYNTNNASFFNISKGFDLHDGLQPTWKYRGRYATDLFTEKSLEIIDRHDKSDPLFLILTHLAGHAGEDGVELGVPDAEENDIKFGYITDPMRRLYAGVIDQLDKSVGRVIKKLAQKNMLQNSIVLFLSDNGAQTVGIYENRGSNWPFRGLKFSLHEGGVRSAAVIYSPIFEKSSYINEQLIHISDWMPTFYAAAGENVDDLGKIDGIDQWDAISKNIETNRKQLLINIDEVTGYSGIIFESGRYKLLNGTYENGIFDDYFGDDGRELNILNYSDRILKSEVNVAIDSLNLDGEKLNEKTIESLRMQLDLSWCRPRNFSAPSFCNGLCLFDLVDDPCETRNIIDDNPEIAEISKQKLDNFFAQIVPQTNKLPDPASSPDLHNNTWCNWLDKNGCAALA